MSYRITLRSLQPPDNPVDPAGFKPSGITVIEGSSGMVPAVLLRLCIASVACSGRDAVFIDGWNSFNPYTLSRIAKSFGGGVPARSKNVLSRIHVARAFTEYQMEALIGNLEEAIECWNPGVLAISYFPSLFSGADGKRLFEPLLERLISLTASTGIITAITSFGGTWYGDRLLAARASRVVRIEQPSKKLIRIIDDGRVSEYVPVPPGQTKITDFAGGDVYGQDRADFSHLT